MIYGSVCSGIEAATVAWKPLGWKASFFSEIEKFPREVLAHHYPDTPLHGDFTTIQKDDYEPIELLVGGTPCQSFSVAGLREGLNDQRGNLMLEFGALAKRLQPKWLLSPSRKKGEEIAGTLTRGFGDRGLDLDQIAGGGYALHTANEVDHCLTTKSNMRNNGSDEDFVTYSLAVAFGVGESPDLAHCLRSGASKADKHESTTYIAEPTMQVRRLMPLECERLQGFSDGYTKINDKTSDSVRYKALGNSMAVPVIKWLGKRFDYIESLQKMMKEAA